MLLFCQRSKHVDGFGVPGVFDGAVGSVVGGVEWQWRQAGSEAWWMVLATHPSCGCVVLGASEEGQFVEGVLGARKARGQRQRDRRLQGRVARRVEGRVVDLSVSEVMKRDQQERVQETTAEEVVTAVEVVTSIVVESVDGCEDRPQKVEVPVFVSGDRIHRLALERLAGFFRGCGGVCHQGDSSGQCIQQRPFEQFFDFPEVVKDSFSGISPRKSFSSVRSVSRC